jgi:hypothetical protein
MTIPAEMFDHPGKFIRVGFGRESLPKILPVMARFLEHSWPIL